MPPRLTNPTVMAPCGLPASYAQFNASATVTTFNMTADCAINAWDNGNNLAFLYFTAGEFTINGNGYSITGPPNGWTIYVQNAGAVLNLNNITIRGGGNSATVTVDVQSGAHLNGRGITFRDNTSARTVLRVTGSGSRATLRNVQFLDNIQPSVTEIGSAIDVTGDGMVTITNGIFRANRNGAGSTDVILVRETPSLVQLQGCMTFENNVQADGSTAANDYGVYRSAVADGRVIDNRTGVCPPNFQSPKKKKKEVPTAAPTSTPRPQIAATHVALQAATGATFRTAFGLDSGVHFRQLDGAGIGVQSIIDAGYLEAFDVYGYVEQGVEVCFPQIGRVVFLDANTSPRAIMPLDSAVVNGQTCVSINSPGSLVLLPN